MSPTTIREAAPADYPAIANIIAEHNRNPESHCIQSSSTDDPSAIEAEIVELYTKDELRFVVAGLDGQLVGLLGCEFDRSLGRGWMRGPFLSRDLWDVLPVTLLETLLAVLPPEIRRLDSFLNEKHTRGNRFYQEIGFQQKSRTHVYFARATRHGSESLKMSPEIKPGQEPAFISLHDSAFPVTHISGRGILEQLDENHKLFVYGSALKVDGYIFLSVDKFAGEGYIEFIAVQPELRGRGIGKALLLSALEWCFSIRGLSGVALTVNDELVNAQALYISTGFQHLYTGVNNRLEW